MSKIQMLLDVMAEFQDVPVPVYAIQDKWKANEAMFGPAPNPQRDMAYLRTLLSRARARGLVTTGERGVYEMTDAGRIRWGDMREAALPMPRGVMQGLALLIHNETRHGGWTRPGFLAARWNEAWPAARTPKELQI